MVFNPQWRPWPGETLKLSVSRPDPVPGDYLAIDSASVHTSVGAENRSHVLTASFRSSRGGAHSIYIPKGSEIQSMTLDSQSIPAGSSQEAERGLEISVPLVPGTKTLRLAFLEPQNLSSITRLPSVDLNLPSANINFTLDFPGDRWLLFTGGPVQGPAVLFWSFAAAIFCLSLILARIGSTPLGTISWFLILVGLSQLHLIGAFFVAGWLIALGLRGSKPAIKAPFAFNCLQIVLALWTALALVLIYQGLQNALLESPSMRVSGNSSSDSHLRWFADRASGPLPAAWALTISNKVYQYVMLAWSLWLAISIIGWLRWGWRCFSSETFWRKGPKTPKPPQGPKGGPPPWQHSPQGYGPPHQPGPPPDPGFAPWPGTPITAAAPNPPPWPQAPQGSPPPLEPGHPPWTGSADSAGSPQGQLPDSASDAPMPPPNPPADPIEPAMNGNPPAGPSKPSGGS